MSGDVAFPSFNNDKEQAADYRFIMEKMRSSYLWSKMMRSKTNYKTDNKRYSEIKHFRDDVMFYRRHLVPVIFSSQVYHDQVFCALI